MFLGRVCVTKQRIFSDFQLEIKVSLNEMESEKAVAASVFGTGQSKVIQHNDNGCVV
jgi:hypothetical protein